MLVLTYVCTLWVLAEGLVCGTSSRMLQMCAALQMTTEVTHACSDEWHPHHWKLCLYRLERFVWVLAVGPLGASGCRHPLPVSQDAFVTY